MSSADSTSVEVEAEASLAQFSGTVARRHLVRRMPAQGRQQGSGVSADGRDAESARDHRGQEQSERGNRALNA